MTKKQHYVYYDINFGNVVDFNDLWQ